MGLRWLLVMEEPRGAHPDGPEEAVGSGGQPSGDWLPGYSVSFPH